MHLLIISPLREGYMRLCSWIKPLTSTKFTILTKKIYYDNFEKMIKFYSLQNQINVVAIDNWNDDSIFLTTCKINKANKINKIFAYTEGEMIIASKLREYLNLPGQSVESAVAFRDKYVMSKYLEKNNKISSPKTYLVNSIEDVLPLMKGKLPIILKPRSGAGSVETFVVKDMKDLQMVVSRTNLNDYIAQEFVVGNVYHIDGLIIGGKLQYLVVSRYLNTPLSYQDSKSLGSIQVQIDSKEDQELKKLAREVLNTLPTPDNTIIHLEAFYDGVKATFLEVACRIGGGRIQQEFIYNLNFDPLQKLLMYEVTGHIDINFHKKLQILNNRRCGFILTTPGTGKLIKLPPQSLFEIPVEGAYDYYVYGKVGYEYSKGHSSSDAISAVSVFGISSTDITKKLISIDKWTRQNTEYNSKE